MSKPYFVNSASTFFALLFGIFCLTSTPATAEVPAAERVHGRYTDWIASLLQNKSYEKLINPTLPDSTEAQPVQVTCLETPKERYYIGVAQSMVIKAPLDEVSKVVENIDQYVDLFPGYAQVKVVSRDKDQLLTFWEERIPVFFIKNVKYEMIYDFSRPDERTRVYRYQLHKTKTKIKESDGFIVLEKLTDKTTRYFELDMFNADWGVLETFAPSHIWNDTVDGIYVSDRATQLKAENPAWTAKQAREAAEKTADLIEKTTHKRPGESCSETKTLEWNKAFPGLPLPK